jgi:exopolysaccharide biosynthesis polyprenyl glycosylphosphotransferase
MTKEKDKPNLDEQARVEQAIEMFARQDFSTVGFWRRLRFSLRLTGWILGIKLRQNAKRALDLVVASLILLLVWPIMLLTAIAIKLDSPGPVIFRQTRVGKWGKPFTCYKFRSMYVDAEERKKELQALNEADGPVFKMKRDPRVTRVGRIIRKLSVDELPQLFNVLKGEMSLVGPRPPIPSEVAQYTFEQRRRLDTVPGLTGLQQVSGRSDLDFERWVAFDVEYIEKQSLWFDIKILLKTVPAVLLGKGAY